MTYEQSLDLAELQADMAFETYLSAFEEGVVCGRGRNDTLRLLAT